MPHKGKYMTIAETTPDLPQDFLVEERNKSNLIVEGNLLKAQGKFENAAAKFAAAATIEEQLATFLISVNWWEKAYVHQFSAISCWAQAGDLYHAIQLGEQFLNEAWLSSSQRQQVTHYLKTLRGRFMQWMNHWVTESPAVVV